jgi:dipeptidyl aminopeptidase/acylaminoacyl peptidase
VLALLLVLLFSHTVAAIAAAPGLEQFAAYAKNSSLVISPDGRHLAVTFREDSKHILTIYEFPAMKVVRSFSFSSPTDVEDVHWIGDTGVLVQPGYLMPGQPRWPTGEIMRVDIAAGKVERLYGFSGAGGLHGSMAGKREATWSPARLLSMNSTQSGHAYVYTDAVMSGSGDEDGIFRMDLRTGRLVRVSISPAPNARVVTGRDNRITVLSGSGDDNKWEVFSLAEGNDAKWTRRVTGTLEEGRLMPVAWTGKGDEYYALDNRDAPTDGVVIWNAATNETRLLYRHPQVDMAATAFDNDERPWLFTGTDHYPVYWYPDPAHPLARMHRAMVQQLPRQLVTVTSQTADYALAVVRIEAADRPPNVVIVDVKSVKPLRSMAAYPDVKAAELAPVDAIEFRARDGLKVRGFLTVPRTADGKPAKKLPMVVMVYGMPGLGAWDYSYDFERQLLASRGYAVLQVNYRGLPGRGRDFFTAGLGEWGRKSEDDIMDAVRWATLDGVADPARLCIYGPGYGALSAMSAAARNPDTFRCVIGMSGVYDLPLLLDSGNALARKYIGDFLELAVGRDKAELKARSPVNYAEAVKAPVMLMHNLADWRAPFEQARRMRAALVKVGNSPEWQIERSEGMGFFGADNRSEGYRKILDFLDRALGR